MTRTSVNKESEIKYYNSDGEVNGGRALLDLSFQYCSMHGMKAITKTVDAENHHCS